MKKKATYQKEYLKRYHIYTSSNHHKHIAMKKSRTFSKLLPEHSFNEK